MSTGKTTPLPAQPKERFGGESCDAGFAHRLPWLPTINGGILVVEDINEHPFRIERLLLQLHHAGILARQKALILGSFNGATLSDYDAGYDFSAMCNMLSERLSIPVLPGLPFGHEPQTVTLPLGAYAELRHDGQRSELTVSGHPVLR